MQRLPHDVAFLGCVPLWARRMRFSFRSQTDIDLPGIKTADFKASSMLAIIGQQQAGQGQISHLLQA